MIRSAVLLLAAPLAAQLNYSYFPDVSAGIVAATGEIELYDLAIPNNPLPNMPVIVVFHGNAGVNHTSVYNERFFPGGWDLFEEAALKGWAVLVPQGGHVNEFPNTTYGWPQLWTWGRRTNHHHVGAAIAHMRSNYTIDPSRVYGYGFSMGGNDVVSYAARNLDPTSGVMFASIVCHSGSFSSCWQYHTAPATQGFWSDIYEAPAGYAINPLPFQEAAAFDFDSVSLLKPDTSMATNLMHMPVASYYDSNAASPDEPADIPPRNVIFEDLMSNRLGHPAFTPDQTTGEGHNHRALATSVIVAALENYRLNVPRSGRLLVPPPLTGATQRMFHFVMRRNSSNQMASISWVALPNRLRLTELNGLATLQVQARDLGFDTTAVVRFDVDSTIGQFGLLVTDFSSVSRVDSNGVTLPTSAWKFSGGLVSIRARGGMNLEIFP